MSAVLSSAKYLTYGKYKSFISLSFDVWAVAHVLLYVVAFTSREYCIGLPMRHALCQLLEECRN